MLDEVRVTVVSRRTFILSATSMLALATPLSSLLQSSSALADTASPAQTERSALFAEDLAKLLSGATPIEGKVTLELPEIAENGNFVPVTIMVDNPMTAEDHVKTIYLLSTNNPVARVATFHLSPINAVARVQSRHRTFGQFDF